MLNPRTDTIVIATTSTGHESVLGYLSVPNWGDAASPVYFRMAEDDRPWDVWAHAGFQVADCRHGELDAARRIFGDEVAEDVEIGVKDPEPYKDRADRLIARSVSYTEIARETYSDGLAAALQRACDGDVFSAQHERHEYWGTTEDGAEWCVHLTDAPR